MNKVLNKVCTLIAIVCVFLLSATSYAEPYIAQKFGLKCSACHTNMTGGGKRNEAGNGYALTLTSNAIQSPFSSQLNDSISIGANIRSDWRYVTFDDPEAAGGIDPEERADQSSFDVSNGALYLDFALSEDITFYLDQQVAPQGGLTREAVVILKNILGENSYIKVGKMYLPYGLRLQDDEAFIRQESGFNFDNSDNGVELGFEPGDFSFSLAVTNGAQGSGDDNRDKQVSFVASYVQSKYRAGFSVSSNRTDDAKKTALNIFGGYTIGDWIFLAEYDQFTEEDAAGNETDSTASFFSINYFVTRSTNIKLALESFDLDTDVDENEKTRSSLIAEYFANQYTQLRGGVRIYDSFPQDAAFGNRQEFFSELHVFF